MPRITVFTIIFLPILLGGLMTACGNTGHPQAASTVNPTPEATSVPPASTPAPRPTT